MENSLNLDTKNINYSGNNYPINEIIRFDYAMKTPIPADQLIKYRDDFESKGKDNGSRTWYARDLMALLGYDDYETFRKKAINKATQACLSLNIAVIDNFQQVNREIDGKVVADMKLSRFACYMTAMNGDVRKPEVATMQAYFIGLAETMRRYIEDGENVDRLIIRDELTEQVNAMIHIANNSGVKDYALFQNAGYRGMYNMNLRDLKTYKGVKQDQTLFDYMGSTELAANLFRITQTSEKIRKENLKGQQNLENAAQHVGKVVRRTMMETGGTSPESLRISENIKDVKRGLKGAHKEFKKLDKPSKRD